jgi:hypothetical protein
MRLLVCALWIGSLLMQQAALPHSHAGAGFAEPAGHDWRPHIHLAAHHHGEHAAHEHAAARHGDASTEVAAHGAARCYGDGSGQHDEDAVYLVIGATTSVVPESAPAGPPADVVSACVEPARLAHSTGRYTWAPPRYGQRVPVFLASTRLLV